MSGNLRTIIGIDEAGYGPRLGPLVTGLAAFRVPEGTGDFRDRLPVPVDDSKRLFSQATGLSRLERSVLAFREVAETSEVPDEPPNELPWRLGFPPESPAAEAAPELADALRELGIETLALVTRTVTVPEFNEGVSRHGSKGPVLFDAAMDLLAPFFNSGEPGEVVVDRHGGRKFYSRPLEERFPGRFHWVEEERAARSAYVFPGPKGDLRISFEVEADSRHPAVALASMAAKYVRELSMNALNAWFGEREPELRPTAGYAQDAGRWLKDSKEVRKRIGIDDGMLIRLK
jgi:ribonuclease HII